jgi:putative endonuclease
MEHPQHATYVLYSLKDQEFYIGSSSDFDRRSIEHEQGRSKSTAPRRPFVPLLCEYYFSKKDSLRREKYFKTSAGKRTLRLMLKDSLIEVKSKRTSD